MARTLIESIIPAIASLFIGPWSDKYGRKPIMLATFSGYFFTYTIISIICFASQYILINPWYYVLAFLPAAISGGNCALITGDIQN
jgi:MFS transporter, PCFT/HCP family, solute carrier family 46 (folate transporter), member 1